MGTALVPSRVLDGELVREDDRVLVALKTPFAPMPVMAYLPADLTLDRCAGAMRKAIPADDLDGRRVLDDVERELKASRVNFLVHGAHHDVAVTAPGTALRDIATLREMRTPQGLKTTPAVSVEVQSYAAVGGR